ncbi:uncharacterized protein F5147DRAFT_775046 [Suillus discolor]|uniref:Uncharacterized protein n=1 Tax=Suillus discolor TaxID=1912936 RepID=A0A9P7F400_9AGAM|nr:uncharacterized protein F5147DRAFT_775046 [Suillus discolor]KAG2106235.1 hypothetical protein F5147DRAFT_775046 [Suillus discolor]
MQKVSDSVTSIFKLETKEESLAKCLQGDSTIVYSKKFGLGWRFGLQYSKKGWSFAKVKVYLDYTHCLPSATDAATVTVCLKDGSTPEVPSFDSSSVSIADVDHRSLSLIGSFWPSVIAAHPYMWFTVAMKATFAPEVIASALINTASALRQSMNNGEFTDTKYYAMSKRRTGRFLGETRAVYANSAILDHGAGVAPVLPSSISENSLFVHYHSQQRLMMDAEQSSNFDFADSDIESEEEVEESSNPPPYSRSHTAVAAPSEFDASSDITSESSALSSDDDNDNWTERAAQQHPGFRSTDTLRTEPQPRPLSPTQQIVLVRNTAFATWASYVYYCYTGQVSFYPLKSKDPLGRRNNTTQTLRCSPKSMYRLALKFKNAHLEALAFQAIKSDLSQKNILDEAFSQFTSQYLDIEKMELKLLTEFRNAPEVSSRLNEILESVTRGERPYAHAMLHGFLINLARQGAGGTK